MNVLGGTVGNSFNAYSGSTININDGDIGGIFLAFDGSKINISGGSIGGNFNAYTGTEVNIMGGAFSDGFRVFSGSTATIFGNDFRLNDEFIEGLESIGASTQFNFPDGSVLSGTLADGTPFAFYSLEGDTFEDGTLTLSAVSLPPIGPSVITLPGQSAPLGVRNGQVLTVNAGGVLDNNFNAGLGSVVNIGGGIVGSNFEAVHSQVNISAGTVNGKLSAFDSSVVSIAGGSIYGDFSAANSTINILDGWVQNLGATNSVVNIAGGTIGPQSRASDGSLVNITGGLIEGFIAGSDTVVNFNNGFSQYLAVSAGGTLGINGGSVNHLLRAYLESTLHIAGGAIEADFVARSGSTTHLSGRQFILDGINITPSLTTGIPLEITDREVTLEGVLSDGSPFSFDLNSSFANGQDFVDPAAALYVTLTPTGDFNSNLTVDGQDFLRWQRGLANPYDPADLADWEANFGTTPPTVLEAAVIPEQSTLVYAGLTGLLFFCLGNRFRCVSVHNLSRKR